MRIKIDFNTLPELFNAKISNSKDIKDLSNIKCVTGYFERNKKTTALKNIIGILNKYIKLENYSNGSIADLSKLPDEVRKKFSDCKYRIKSVDSYIDQEFVVAEEVLNK